AQWTRNTHPMNHFRVFVLNVRIMQHKLSWNPAVPTKALWDGHMKFGRHEVRKLMQAQGCLMAVNSLADSLAIFRPQPPQHEIRPIVLGKFRKTVNSTMFSNPVSRLYVVGMCILC